MTSGLSSFGGSLMDMSGVGSLSGATALRIIPDVRSNSLYVQGPADAVRQVDELLAQIDAPKPGTERDRVARPIPVEYADVNEVADIVREVYKEQTADGLGSMAGMFGGGGRGGRGGGNPLAMLMGGGGDDEDGPSVQLSVAVDTRTSRLIVSAPDDLFTQVQTLVRDLDDAAKDANRSVRFVTLKDADAAFVTQSLGAMMPGVTSGSVVRSPRTVGQGGSPAAPTTATPTAGSDDGGARDAMRAMMMQRMMQGGGGFGGRAGEAGDAGGGRGGGGQRGGGRTRGGR